MATIVTQRYPLDYTGESQDNLIVGEEVEMVMKRYRCIAPISAPFFKKNLVITDLSTGEPLEESQYQLFGLVGLPSALAGIGNEVYSIIVIKDTNVGDTVSLEYNTVGGKYTSSFESTKLLLENILTDNRPSSWGNLLNRAEEFDPAAHFQSMQGSTGWEHLVVEIEKLRTAIELGDELGRSELYAYLDSQRDAVMGVINNLVAGGGDLLTHINNTNNPHGLNKADVNLGLVQNFPVATQQEALEGIANNRYMTAALVAFVLDSRGNAGLDGHIGDTNNPHEDDKSSVGLSNVENYPVATVEEITTPAVNFPRYVTNVALKSYLNTFFSGYTINLTTEVTYVKGVADTALINANSAKATALSSLATITAASANSLTAKNLATAANSSMIAVNDGLQASIDAAEALFTEFQATSNAAIAAAAAAAYTNGVNVGYASGYADGLAA